MRDTAPDIGSFVALGDSFTEGVGDPYPDGMSHQDSGRQGAAPQGPDHQDSGRQGPDHQGPDHRDSGHRGFGYRGWADRFAERLAADRLAVGQTGLRYANLAVRGRMVGQVAADQVPVAVAMAPGLVSIAAGGNDLLRPRADPDALAQAFEVMVTQLRAAGCEVLLFTGFDPGAFPLIRLIRGKVAAYNMHLRVIAGRHGCRLVDLWSMRMLGDPREWCADRLHLGPDGHRRVALRACEIMGVSTDADWREPLPSRLSPQAALARTTGWLAARRLDAHWAREYAVPWVGRRLRGVSSGDGIAPKRPELLPL
jgi:lysophospholipase L1-like esterase